MDGDGDLLLEVFRRLLADGTAWRKFRADGRWFVYDGSVEVSAEERAALLRACPGIEDEEEAIRRWMLAKEDPDRG